MDFRLKKNLSFTLLFLTRLRCLARSGNKIIVASGPTYQSMKVRGRKIILSFTNIGGGLMSKGSKELREFAIAGQDKKFVWATAIVNGNLVEVWNDDIANPIAVRYAWADNPQEANLYKKEGLPATPFRTDKD